jgi:hypothetical protein
LPYRGKLKQTPADRELFVLIDRFRFQLLILIKTAGEPAAAGSRRRFDKTQSRRRGVAAEYYLRILFRSPVRSRRARAAMPMLRHFAMTVNAPVKITAERRI